MSADNRSPSRSSDHLAQLFPPRRHRAYPEQQPAGFQTQADFEREVGPLESRSTGVYRVTSSIRICEVPAVAVAAHAANQ